MLGVRALFPHLSPKTLQHEGEGEGVGLMVGWEEAVADPSPADTFIGIPPPSFQVAPEPWYKPNPHT